MQSQLLMKDSEKIIAGHIIDMAFNEREKERKRERERERERKRERERERGRERERDSYRRMIYRYIDKCYLPSLVF